MAWAPTDFCADDDAKENSNRCPNGRVKNDLMRPLVKDEDRKALGIELGMYFLLALCRHTHPYNAVQAYCSMEVGTGPFLSQTSS